MNFSKLETQNKILLVSFVVFLVLYILLTYRQKPKEIVKEVSTQLDTADTYIPAGHVLAPIEIENYESVSGIVGAFALVDLYSRNQAVGSNELVLVAQKIKLIRAPLNPNQYAVLVKETESAELLKMNPRFWVTIHNQKNLAQVKKNQLQPELIQNTKVLIADKPEEVKKPLTKRKSRTKRAQWTDEIEVEYYESKKARYL